MSHPTHPNPTNSVQKTQTEIQSHCSHGSTRIWKTTQLKLILDKIDAEFASGEYSPVNTSIQ